MVSYRLPAVEWLHNNRCCTARLWTKAARFLSRYILHTRRFGPGRCLEVPALRNPLKRPQFLANTETSSIIGRLARSCGRWRHLPSRVVAGARDSIGFGERSLIISLSSNRAVLNPIVSLSVWQALYLCYIFAHRSSPISRANLY